MVDAGYALHKAILAKLKSLCSVPVFDAVPRDSKYPYIELDGQQGGDAGFVGAVITERFFYLSVWSESRGQAEVLKLLGEVKQIDRTKLTLEGGQVVTVRVIRTGADRDADGVTYMGSATLRIVTKD